MSITGLASLHTIVLAAGPLGGILHVPADYATIQACIDAALSGVDECVVAPGTYNETINFLGKAITVRSSGGRDITTIDATGIVGAVVACYSGEGPDTVLDGFTITGATGMFGGGMFNRESSPTVTNCTFSGNTANEGGGMFTHYNSSALVTDCILWGDSPEEIVNYDPSTTTIRFSNVQGGLPIGTVDGGGNFNLDPMFIRLPDPGPDGTWDGVDDDYGDLRLQAGSPCINAGDSGFVAQPGETDLEGHARVLCGRVDMGAYEFGIGDHNCDQIVDLDDFTAWSACMTGPGTADTAVAHILQSKIDNRQSAAKHSTSKAMEMLISATSRPFS